MATQGIDPAFNNAFSALAGGVSKLPESYLAGQKARVAQEAMANSAAHNDRVATLNEDKWRTQRPGVEATTRLTTAKAAKTEGENVANELFDKAIRKAIVMKMDPVSQNDIPTLTDNSDDLASLVSAAHKSGRNPDQAVESLRNLLSLNRGMSDDPNQRIQSQNLRTKSQASDSTITSVEDRDSKAKAKTDAAASRTAATIAGADARNKATITAAGERNAAAIAGRVEAAKAKPGAASNGKFSIADETAVNSTGGMAETAIDLMVKKVLASNVGYNKDGKQVVMSDSDKTRDNIKSAFQGSEVYHKLKDLYSREFKRVYIETKDATAAKAAADASLSKQSKHEVIGRGFQSGSGFSGDWTDQKIDGQGAYEYRTQTYNPAATPAAAVSAPAPATAVVAPAAETPAAAVAPAAAVVPPVEPAAVVPPVVPPVVAPAVIPPVAEPAAAVPAVPAVSAPAAAVSTPATPIPAVAPVAPVPAVPGEPVPLVPASSATPPVPLPATSPAAALTPAAAVSTPIVPPTAAVAPTAMPATIPVPGPGPTASAPATAVMPPAVGGAPATGEEQAQPSPDTPAAAVAGPGKKVYYGIPQPAPLPGLETNGGPVYNPQFDNNQIQASASMPSSIPPSIPSGIQPPLMESVKSGLESPVTPAEMVSFRGSSSGAGSSVPKTPYATVLNDLVTMRDVIKRHPVKSEERDGFGDPTGVFSSKEDEFRIKQLDERIKKLESDPMAKVSPAAALLNNEFMTVPGLIVSGTGDVPEKFKKYVVTGNEVRYLLGSISKQPGKFPHTDYVYPDGKGGFLDAITVAEQFDKAHPDLVKVFIQEGRLGMKPGDSLATKILKLHEQANDEITGATKGPEGRRSLEMFKDKVYDESAMKNLREASSAAGSVAL